MLSRDLHFTHKYIHTCTHASASLGHTSLSGATDLNTENLEISQIGVCSSREHMSLHKLGEVSNYHN